MVKRNTRQIGAALEVYWYKKPVTPYILDSLGIFITNIWRTEARILILMFADDTKLGVVTDTPEGCAAIAGG